MKLSRVLKTAGFTVGGGSSVSFTYTICHQVPDPWILFIVGLILIIAASIAAKRTARKEQQDRVARRFEQLVGQVRMM